MHIRRIEEKDMSVSQAFGAPVDEIMESIELADCTHAVRLEPRCRVCRTDELRRKVNSLLASGASYAFILRSLAMSAVSSTLRSAPLRGSARRSVAAATAERRDSKSW